MPKLFIDYNSADLMKQHVHGMHRKSLIVLHETVSGDIAGLGDIVGVEKYLASKDYGIHGMTDSDGHIAWALGWGRAVFYQAGGVNRESIGIEQVSRVMLQSPSNVVRRKLWALRKRELRATAKLIASICEAHGIPIQYSDSRKPGITSHWDVSKFHKESEGHTDCWPVHKGGYYPILEVIQMAKVYAKVGYHF
jgi:hypothetical protein